VRPPTSADQPSRTTVFDTVVIVDWSANARPKQGADSIWIAQVDVASGETQLLANPDTRMAARELLADLLAHAGSTLVGFDFPFGYPAGFASAAGLTGNTPWRAVWQHLAESIVDDDRNRNNRWEVAAELNHRLGKQWFWGAPRSRAGANLTATKPAFDGPPHEYRVVEQRLRGQQQRPFSCRQLLGVGSVGSQAITGIPVLEHLRAHPALDERVRVWPFEPLDLPSPDRIVLAEVWPSYLPTAQIADVDHPIKDAQQVIALAGHLAEQQRNGVLDALLARAVAPHLDPHTADGVGREEGWVLLV
jgi:precorrin-8X/cobalt-precorrin-8 methylmutase